MERLKCKVFKDAPSAHIGQINLINKANNIAQLDRQGGLAHRSEDVDVDLQEVYFLIMHFLSAGPCQKTFGQFQDELLKHGLLPRRYHAWYSRAGVPSGDESDSGISFPLSYESLRERYSHIRRDHLVKLLKQLVLNAAPPSWSRVERTVPRAGDVPTLLGAGAFSLLRGKDEVNEVVKHPSFYLRWPHMQAGQVHGLTLREIGGGFSKHHRSPSIRFACYAMAKPSTMVQKIQNIKKLRGHRDAVYCAIHDRSGRYVITGSDDRLVKIWSMETAFCLASCRGHEGDITDLAVNSTNVLVASASNDFSIRVWRLPDGFPVSVLRGHTGAVTAIAFSPRIAFHLLSSSDDGTCRIWDARSSDYSPRVYLPKPTDVVAGKSAVFPSTNVSLSSNFPLGHQILCCAFNAHGTVFVTGSSDTYARVWNACKPTTDDPEKPSHEIEVLVGHENDVNYVQFSGCAVASRCSTFDFSAEDNFPKFKNSWFSHDNIVTCSRDGSAIIWTPKPRRSHGRIGRWTKAYHLKVPPPPMPPQPPRGGPRQRLLPTPRGVNMIMWSLDNRFVLAAIMDCRICVWNASDGSLVHSLTGHSASTYVLDVHPFNPRIAMSAGYDGRTIVWDIWEGIPVKTYEFGERFKLVDGKFSPDGTSIVLSDDVGQIYLLNTGQGESQQDAKYDQFFLGDYRPLMLDTNGNVVDQETQLAPYKRNLQDPLCDSSLLPYPEPYQSMYQRRRLGALGYEWRPSSIQLAVGTDIGLGQEFQILPLADWDRVNEPLPDFLDAMYWEPENDLLNDDTDSEYNVVEEDSSQDELRSLSDSSCSDPDRGDQEKGRLRKRDRLRRSKRKNSVAEVESFSARRVKKKTLHERGGTSSRSKRSKKKRNRRNSSLEESTKAKLSRPQRIAALNAINNFSQVREDSSDVEDEDEDEDDMQSDSSGSDSLESSYTSNGESDEVLEKEKHKCLAAEQVSLNEFEDVVACPKPISSSGGIRKKLVLKFSKRDSKRTMPSENMQDDKQANFEASSSKTSKGASEANLDMQDPVSPCADLTDVQLPDNCETILFSANDEFGKSENVRVAIENRVKWGEVKLRTSKRMQSEDMIPVGSCSGSRNHLRTMSYLDDQVESLMLNSTASLHAEDQRSTLLNKADRRKEYMDVTRNKTCSPTEDAQNSSLSELRQFHVRQKVDKDSGVSCNRNASLSKGDPSDAGNNHTVRPTRIKIKTKMSLRGSESFPTVRSTPAVEQNQVLEPVEGRDPDRPNHMQLVHFNLKPHGSLKSCGSNFNQGGYCGESSESALEASMHNAKGSEFPDAATDVTRRERSMSLKATSRETTSTGHNLKMREDHTQKLSLKIGEESHSSSRGWMSHPRTTVKLRSSKKKVEDYSSKDECGPAGNSNWLLLSEPEGYRYIPQLADEVVYFCQGHQEYIKQSSRSTESGPWMKCDGNIRAAEYCLVEDLNYATLPGSGESCCKITLKFVDPTSYLVNRKFKLTLPELSDFPDFLVERRRYEAATNRNWACRDKCLVWWKDDSAAGGRWWEGRIVSIKDKSNEFPGSPWERYGIQYQDDSKHYYHSPWELHDTESPWEHQNIDQRSRQELLALFAQLMQSAREDKDRYGILKLKQLSRELSFINRFPVPLSLELIESRLMKNYYRSLEAVKHDIEVMIMNAKAHLVNDRGYSKRLRRLSEYFAEALSKF